MKQEYSYNEWTIKSHASLFYLFQDENKKARSDDIKSLKAYIDGVMYGRDEGGKEWFTKYMELKTELRKIKSKVV